MSLNDSDGGMTIQEAMVQRIHNQQSEESDGRQVLFNKKTSYQL